MKHPYFFHLKYESGPIYKPRPEKFELTQEGRELSSPSWWASCGPVADRLRTTSAKIAPGQSPFILCNSGAEPPGDSPNLQSTFLAQKLQIVY